MSIHTKINNGLFIFHRDFRITDNIGLLEASKLCNNLYTCFIFTPEQVGSANNYRSQNAIQFMIESLEDLESEIHIKNGKLLTLYGNQESIIRELVNELKIEGIFFNKDYTPYAVQRDRETVELCKRLSIECQMFSDYYLYEPGTITTGGNAYKKYTPFYLKVIHINPKSPSLKRVSNLANTTKTIKHKISLTEAMSKFTKINPSKLVEGGRANAILRLKNAVLNQKHYDEKRDFFIEKTTFLSAYIKFGCVSIREVYSTIRRAFGLNHGIIRELLWREFFAHVLYSYPEVVGKSYQPKYHDIHWMNSTSLLEKWQKGQTGFPIVDACMRQLNSTGYMHNRGRMTVACFLVKTLLIDWRKGEQYFAKQLTDYDIASNNGNWQGISSTGVDMKPYYRDMNPWIQSIKFDKEAEFIKHWVPELKNVDSRDIHKWYQLHNDPKYKDIEYPKPIVDYDEQKIKMMDMYENT
jgi:deoxyribodipyrimidine photo-lyase